MKKFFFLLCITFSNEYAESSMFHSQYGQDEFIYKKFFNNEKGPGFFIDIGAFDGITLSNTYFFEKELKWDGICIEPLPEDFKNLVNNRTCLCIDVCISDNDDQKEFLIVENETMLSGLKEKYDPRHLMRIDNVNGNKTIIMKQCYTLNTILQKYNINHIDYLSIDTEGGELDILKAINFDKITIDIIDVENNYSDKEIRSFLAEKNYEFITHLGVDDIFKRRDFNITPHEIEA